mmetsp:Transcript_19913/g.46502  ORF Transcript_19913/g.46502 Transcript_19913/m.46502 type:complete len:230 (+) Transcript_19913:19-708(+)
MSHEASERVAEPLKVVLDDATPVPTLQVLEDGKSWVLHNVFSETECQNLIAESERLQFDKLTGYRSDYRRNDRLIIDHPELAGVLFERIKFAVPEIVTIDAADHSLGFGLGGIWERDELNYHVRICRYEPGGFFQAHRDGHYMPDSETRSFFTAMLYLNAVEEGGETNFLDEEEHIPIGECAPPNAIKQSVAPARGQVLLFWHPLLHEGATVRRGHKYMLRSEGTVPMR